MMRIWARLKQHWVRHLLAALQVAIGVAVVTAILVDVAPLIRQSMPDRKAVVFSAFYGGRTDDGGMFMTSAFGVDDVHYVESEFDTVEAASVYDGAPSSLVRVDGDLYMLRGIAEVSPGFAQVANMKMAAGRFFLPDDVEKGVPDVAVISTELAELIFPGEDPLGRTINMRPNEEEMRLFGYGSFTLPSTEGVPGLDVMVVGVFEQPKNVSDFEGPLSGTSRSEMYIPATGQMLWSLPAFNLPVSNLDDPDDTFSMPGPMEASRTYSYLHFKAHEGMGEQAVAEVQTLLGARFDERHGDDQHFNDMASTLIVDPGQAMDPWLLEFQFRQVLILGALGVAALVVAGFSVFTTFLASVTERVRAIGLARSLGATRGRVLREVVSEAVLLTGIGGLVGALLAYPVRIYMLEPLEDFFIFTGMAAEASDVVLVVLAALVVAMGIGALAALYPGWTVARLMPAEAFDED